MSDNPYAFARAIPAAQAPADERAAFLRKVYSLLLAGILAFAGTLWAAANVQPVQDMAVGLWRAILGAGGFGWILYMAIMLGGFFVVHAVAAVKPLNLIAYFGWSFLLALLTAPLVLGSAAAAPAVLTQASTVTALVFTGLTAFVFVTGKDFSFLRGILGLGIIVLVAMSLCAWIWGFGSPLLFSGLGVALFSGYILYDTGNVLHRYPTHMAVSAAVILFTDVVFLFKNILILLMSLNND